MHMAVATPLAIIAVLAFVPAPAQTPYGFRFIRTDQAPGNVIYDRFHQRFFVSVPGTNTIYVVSETDGAVQTKLSVPGPNAMDLSVDGSRLYVVSNEYGGGVDGFFVLDTNTLQVVDLVTPVISARDALVALPETHTVLSSLAALNNGKVMYAAWPKGTSGEAVFLYDPVTGIAAPRPPSLVEPGGRVTKSLDGSRVAVLTPSGLLSIYDVASDRYISQQTASVGWDAVLSPDGSRVLVDGMRLLDQNLNHIADLQQPGAYIAKYGGAEFSPDGYTFYTNNAYGNTPYPKARTTIFSSSTGVPIGFVPSMAELTGPARAALAVGVTGTAVLLEDRGFAEVDVSRRKAQLAGAVAPIFSVSPHVGVPASPSSSAIEIAGYEPGTRVFYGDQESTNVRDGANSPIYPKIVAQPPPAMAGPVSITVAFPNGWASYSPEAYAYGPVILFTDLNAGLLHSSCYRVRFR
jgi:hypothetical protein